MKEGRQAGRKEGIFATIIRYTTSKQLKSVLATVHPVENHDSESRK
jgi:hypothetical protein